MVHLLVTVRTGPVAMESFTLPLLSPPVPHPYFSIAPLPFIFCLPPSYLVLSPRSSFDFSPSFRVPLLSHACLLYLGLRVSLRSLLSLVSRLFIVPRLSELGLLF